MKITTFHGVCRTKSLTWSTNMSHREEGSNDISALKNPRTYHGRAFPLTASLQLHSEIVSNIERIWTSNSSNHMHLECTLVCLGHTIWSETAHTLTTDCSPLCLIAGGTAASSARQTDFLKASFQSQQISNLSITNNTKKLFFSHTQKHFFCSSICTSVHQICLVVVTEWQIQLFSPFFHNFLF